jgi:hypothetical protein
MRYEGLENSIECKDQVPRILETLSPQMLWWHRRQPLPQASDFNATLCKQSAGIGPWPPFCQKEHSVETHLYTLPTGPPAWHQPHSTQLPCSMQQQLGIACHCHASYTHRKLLLNQALGLPHCSRSSCSAPGELMAPEPQASHMQVTTLHLWPCMSWQCLALQRPADRHVAAASPPLGPSKLAGRTYAHKPQTSMAMHVLPLPHPKREHVASVADWLVEQLLG